MQSVSTLIVCLSAVAVVLFITFLIRAKGRRRRDLLNIRIPPSPVLPVSAWQRVLQKTQSKWFRFESKETIIRKEQLEEALLGADVGFKASHEFLNKLDFTKSWGEVQKDLSKLIASVFPMAATWPQRKTTPHVILFVGVNGVGKTTSIAKLAKELKSNGSSVLLAAGDTFRAAASDQLKAWAERIDVPCVAGGTGADSSSVIFDAVKSGISKNTDYVFCDSAGRLHNNDQLMENLVKNKRVLEKAMPGSPHDIVLVLDANTGQNMLNQGKKFLELGVTGLILTKLDGSAKGGAIIPLVQELKLPILKVGVGEGETDMMPFDPDSFSQSLVGA